MTVIGPHIAFSDFVRRRKVHRIGGPDEEIVRSRNHQSARSPQQSFVDGDEVPQTLFDVVGEARGQLALFL
jgi:hypothetical protein